MKTILFTLFLLVMTAAPAKADTTTIYFDSLDQPFQTIDMCIFDTLVVVNSSNFSFFVLDNPPMSIGTLHVADSLIGSWHNGTGYFWNFASYCTDGEVQLFHQFSHWLFTIHFTNPMSVTDTTICSGESVLFDGIARTTSGIYLSSSSSCDSASMLDLTVIQPQTDTIHATTCPSVPYSFNGTLYTEPGTYYDTLQSAGGCDSVFQQLVLTHLSPVILNFSATVCDGASYSFGGTVYTEPGTYYDTILSAGGCDSIVKQLHLAFHPPIAISAEQADLTLSATAAAGATIHWVDCASNYSWTGTDGNTFIPDENGEYAAIGYLNGCADTSQCIAVTHLGVHKQQNSTVTLYPVPATDHFVLSTALPAGTSFSLSDVLGKSVLEGTTEGKETIVKLGQLTVGTYLLKVADGSCLKVVRE